MSRIAVLNHDAEFVVRASPPARHAILQQTELVLSSGKFRTAPALRKFLNYAVLETLNGRGHLLKEYSIGLEVFGRGESFDPRVSNIVRVEASKLRTKLSKYYDEEGSEDPIRIELPKGGYAASFQWNTAARHAGSAPASIAVLPFVNLNGDGNDFFSDGLTEDLIASLARAPGALVVGRTSAFAYKGKAIDVRMIGRDLNVRSVLEGSVRQSGSRLRVTARLSDVNSGYQLWTSSYDREIRDSLMVQREIADTISAALRIEAVAAGRPTRPKGGGSRLMQSIRKLLNPG